MMDIFNTISEDIPMIITLCIALLTCFPGEIGPYKPLYHSHFS